MCNKIPFEMCNKEPFKMCNKEKYLSKCATKKKESVTMWENGRASKPF